MPQRYDWIRNAYHELGFQSASPHDASPHDAYPRDDYLHDDYPDDDYRDGVPNSIPIIPNPNRPTTT